MEPAGHDGEGKKEPAPSPADQMRATGSGRRKVALPPGRSQLDWIRNSRQIQTPYPRRLTMKEVKSHRSRESAWMVVRDQVFDVTPYVEYHPGGVDMIMLGAGRVSRFPCRANYAACRDQRAGVPKPCVPLLHALTKTRCLAVP